MYSKKQFIVFFLCIFMSVPAFGQTIQVVTEELAPYNYTENDNVVGFCTEVVQEVLKRANLEYSIHSYPWAKSYEIAQSQPNVLIYSIGRNVEREPLFKWAGVLAQIEIYFLKLKSRVDIRIKTLDDAKKHKIGTVRDDFRAQFLAKEGFTDQLDLVDSDRDNIRNLFDHKIDITPIDELTAYHITNQEGYSFYDLEKTLYIKDVSVELYIAFSNQTSDDIVGECRKALLNIKEDGTYEEIKSKYEIFSLPIFELRSY